MPLVIISAGAFDPATWPIEECVEVRRELSADFATFVPDTWQVVAEQSGHDVHQTQPSGVVDLIVHVVAAFSVHSLPRIFESNFAHDDAGNGTIALLQSHNRCRSANPS
jgi:hypothetical protein